MTNRQTWLRFQPNASTPLFSSRPMMETWKCNQLCIIYGDWHSHDPVYSLSRIPGCGIKSYTLQYLVSKWHYLLLHQKPIDTQDLCPSHPQTLPVYPHKPHTVGSGDYKMRGLAGLIKYKAQGILLAKVHKKNNSHYMFIHPHKPHIILFLSYLNQLHHF